MLRAMLRSDPSPPVWRIVAAFVVAPLCAAFAFTLFISLVIPHLGGLFFMTPIVILLGAYLTTLVFGLPAFGLLYSELQPTAFRCAAAGAAVAAMPWFLLLPLDVSPDSFGLLGFIALVSAAGLVGGLAFWMVAAARMPSGLR